MIQDSAKTIRISDIDWLYPAFLTSGEGPDGVPVDSVTPEKVRDLSRFEAGHRRKLVDGILADLHRWGAPPSAIASAERLSEEGAGAVVTGQQAGIAGGPLYTIYKAIGTIRAAEHMNEQEPDRSVVPVFWVEDEDHDFDEIRSVGLFERSGDFREISYDDGDRSAHRIADRTVDPDRWRTFVEEVVDVIGETDFTDEFVASLNEAYLEEGRTLADGFARFLYQLLGEETELVLLSATNPELRSLAADILEEEALHPEETHDAVVAGTERAAAAGLPTPIDPRPGHLFMLHGGERTSLDVEEDRYRLRRTGRTMTREEVAGIARERPEILSGNVALRPVVQDAILPTLLYLGGPGELAYHGQLGPLYERAGVTRPTIAPRPFVLLLETKVIRTLESEEIELKELLARDFDPVTRVVDEEKEEEIEGVKERATSEIEAAFSRFADLIEAIDPTLEKAAGASATRVSKEVESLAGRLRGALKRTHDTEINRLRSARTLLLPGEKLQERQVSILHYLNRYGLDRMREVLSEVDSSPGAVQVIEVG